MSKLYLLSAGQSIVFFYVIAKVMLRFQRAMGIDEKFYPKHYITPPWFVRKEFGLDKRKVLIYICCLLYISNIFLINLFISILFWFLTYKEGTVAIMRINIALFMMIGICHIGAAVVYWPKGRTE